MRGSEGGEHQQPRVFLGEGTDSAAVCDLCFLFREHYVSHTRVKASVQTEAPGLYIQPRCFSPGKILSGIAAAGEANSSCPVPSWNRDSNVLNF